MNAPPIMVDRLSKWYGQVIGLNDVSVTIPTGITGLLGPNGAGKSTFLALVGGQLKPSKGTVRVLGEPVWRNPAAFARIGVCPAHDGFYERMTGFEWLVALAGLHGFDEKAARQAAEYALDIVGLAEAAGRRIGAYSKGMRQRVKLAQAFVHDPELLLLDEPLSGLDPIGRRRVIRLIRDQAHAGKSLLVSSHVLHEVEAMTSNILLIHHGRILAEGDVHEIRALMDEHPHKVQIKAEHPRAVARELLAFDDVVSLHLESGTVVAQTVRPDAFYTRLTEMAATGAGGTIEEVTSPDDNLEAVFAYLVK